MTTAVGFIMLAIIVILLLTNKTSIIPVFGIIPIVAALILGYGLKDIQGFMNNGFSSVLNTVVLFSFAVMFFRPCLKNKSCTNGYDLVNY